MSDRKVDSSDVRKPRANLDMDLLIGGNKGDPSKLEALSKVVYRLAEERQSSEERRHLADEGTVRREADSHV